MLNKQAINLNFAEGLDTKTDPKQVQFGKFLSLRNSVFTNGGLLQKRNGNKGLLSLPQAASYATTFNGNLTAIGTSLQALSTQWVNKGQIQPLTLSVLPLVRNNLNQTQSDTATAPSGLMCVVYTENDGSANAYKYLIMDSVTGQNVVAPTAISAADVTYGTPKVFLLGNYFIIVYAVNVAGSYHLVYIAINTTTPTIVTAQANISTSYTPATTLAFDGAVFNGKLYMAWNGAATSGIKMVYLTSALALSATVNPDPSHVATIMSVAIDQINDVIWASYYDSGSSTGYTLAISSNLALLTHFPTQIIASGTIDNIASAAQAGVNTVFYETDHQDNGTPANFVSRKTIIQSSGTVSAATVVLRSVGLASKAFIIDGTIYFLAAYSSEFQPTYFLVNGSQSTSTVPLVISEIAYENGGGYLVTGLPSVTVSGTTASVAYLFKDLIEALSNANAAGTATVGGVYSQTGVNSVSFVLGTQGLLSSEIGKNLNISGGFLWAYDGYSIVEQGFHLWPEPVQSTANASTGGFLAAQAYFYQATYEWSDNQGNIFRSAGSVPIEVDLSTSMTATNEVTLVVPTLRITAKVANPVKIVIYRWSTAQQNFYQITSILAPTLNDTTIDSITYVDTQSDASILGNNIIYTTGGVIEDTGAPSSSIITLFDDRLWLVDAEDPNLLWFSKQVIEATPVEMSDLLTLYVAPTIGSQGSTGQITALAAMDDKLIIFKNNAIYYINGTGPDNTGANNQYSPPIFITSTVGCANPYSIVFIPSGLMFQSDKGIWLLGRDLSTNYIGAPVEQFNGSIVQSSVNIPGENQVRFTLNTGETLMFDYYYNQWGTFVGVPSVSSTLYQSLHTYIDKYGRVFQENPGSYLDGASPVLMSFTTSWLNAAGLQGYQRAFFFYLLGQYFSPFKLMCSVAYDYVADPSQNTIIYPTNFNPTYGGTEANGQNTTYGSDSPYGGQSGVLNWRVFLSKQRCSAFQISIQEVYDASFGVVAGQGFSLSGLNLVFGIKKGFRPISSAHSTGSP